MTTVQVKLPPKLVPVFSPPRGSLRYRAAYGGRGSGKSFTFAKMALIFGYAEPLRILCTRELQVSIKESMHAELKKAIDTEPWLANHYSVGETFITGRNGTEFLFRGLRHNISAIKSMSGIDICIVEEASDVPSYSWQALIPTIRSPGSEIWAVWNPKFETDPIDAMIRQNTPPRTASVEINYQDNPWFPAELDETRVHDRSVMSQAEYAWIWEGHYLKNSDAQVFANKWRVDTFVPAKQWDGPYQGLDFGFAQDPTAAIRCWIYGNVLYIEHEAGKIGLDIDHTAAFISERIEGFDRYPCRADSARPETISYLNRNGMPHVRGVKKWPGSVEDGITFLRSFEKIVIHERCRQTRNEFALYSYKTDKRSGDILTDIEDRNNHYIDALRYAVEPMIKRRRAGILGSR